MQTNYSLINYNRRNIPEMQGLSNNYMRKPIILCDVTSIRLLVRTMYKFGHAKNILTALRKIAENPSLKHKPMKVWDIEIFSNTPRSTNSNIPMIINNHAVYIPVMYNKPKDIEIFTKERFMKMQLKLEEKLAKSLAEVEAYNTNTYYASSNGIIASDKNNPIFQNPFYGETKPSIVTGISGIWEANNLNDTSQKSHNDINHPEI